MKTCEKCGGLLVPKKEGGETTFHCRSCGEDYKEAGDDLKIVNENKEEKKINIESEEDVNLPETEKKCPECGHGKAYRWLTQTRSSDEAETRFFKCKKCGHTWREYD